MALAPDIHATVDADSEIALGNTAAELTGRIAELLARLEAEESRDCSRRGRSQRSFTAHERSRKHGARPGR